MKPRLDEEAEAETAAAAFAGPFGGLRRALARTSFFVIGFPLAASLGTFLYLAALADTAKRNVAFNATETATALSLHLAAEIEDGEDGLRRAEAAARTLVERKGVLALSLYAPDGARLFAAGAPFDGADQAGAALRAIDAGGGAVVSRFRAPSGERRIGATAGVPIVVDGRLAAVATAVLDRTRAAEAIEAAHLAFAGEVALIVLFVFSVPLAALVVGQRQLVRRNASLAEARDAAQIAERAKSEFLATISHELRTPMNGVIGMTELLGTTTLDEHQRKSLGVIGSSAKALLAIINDILDFSKMDAGRMTIEEASFELDAVAKQSVDFVARAAHEKGLELMIRVDPTLPREVVGDFGRLRQVVTNLVANAVKFTPEGEVAIDLLREGDDDGAPRLRIEVADTGVGVPAEKIDAIFDEFSQVDGSETRRHTGTGLGLAICKGLVDLMGGRVGVSSEVGLGSVFWVSLPLRAADGAAAPGDAPRADEPRLDGARCLVVDDHERHREILGEILAGGGASVELAASAREAAKRLDAAAADGRPFDLVAIDGDMPGASGADLVRGLREEGRLEAARVLMLDPAGGETSAAEDVDGRIDKPTTPALLRAAAAQALASGAATNPTGPAPARGATTPAEATPSILLIEDNDVNRIVVTEALDLIGRSAWLAVDGAEGVAAYMKHRPKTVLMDLSMPVLDGIGATKEIRRLEALHGLPRARIVAVTAHAALSDRARCLEAGMDAYLAKPFAVKDLYAVLRDENGDALDMSAA